MCADAELGDCGDYIPSCPSGPPSGSAAEFEGFMEAWRDSEASPCCPLALEGAIGGWWTMLPWGLLRQHSNLSTARLGTGFSGATYSGNLRQGGSCCG